MIIPGEISIDYEAAIQRSRELQEASEQCSVVADSISRLTAVLETSWKGVSGNSVMEFCNRWRGKEKTISEKMSTVSRQIQMVADAIRQADENAAARNRA